jgi:hypothetical protein
MPEKFASVSFTGDAQVVDAEKIEYYRICT